MMNKLWLRGIQVGAVAALLGVSIPQQTTQAASKQTLNWTETAELATADISQATDTLSFNVLLNTQEGLYRFNKKGQPRLALARKAKVSEDGLRYDFWLRPHAQWSNGDPITAQDFVYSWQRTVNPKTNSQDAFYLYQIKNAEEINQQKADLKTLGIKAVSKHHLTVNLTKPVPYFKKLLAWPLFFPQNQKVVEQYGKSYGTSSQKTLASGPFVLKKWDGSSSSWSLVKNKHYWDQKRVKLQKINESVVKDPQTGLSLYENHKVDATILAGEQVPNYQGQAAFTPRKSSNMSYLTVNQKKVPALKNKKLRQALSLTINRSQLVKHVLQDKSLTPQGFTPQGLAKDPQTGQDFAKSTLVKSAVGTNVKKAKKLWRQGLKETHTKNLNLTLTIDDTATDKKTGEFIQGSMAKLPHLKVTLKTLPKVQRLTQERKGNYDLVATKWQSVFSDPINFLDIWETGSSYNASGYQDSKFDHYLDLSENKYANQPQKRWKVLQKAERRLLQQQPLIPLYQATQAQLLNPQVKGIVYNGSGVPYDFKLAHFTKE
ncbi:peptide ABC transporter substrate-binding protein [Lactobacillus sp. DCY120]|uniref:Peptide ABC transporter substrate-binding protein n=1 Tax=Bombilactobacillus apium TaxID=2675299 RepID=A0A850R2C7_9LACO|nr:peptide ABC transporter substrate-binding protein [Bombilactobacillus apium]NVY97073.1 peptide ABC transporter substrate-binding protein [Bombilactobacillus apium]